MSYQRVLPRDLFNEAKLLKCLGQVALAIHEGRCRLRVEHLCDTEGFFIAQDPNDGRLSCRNLVFTTRKGQVVTFQSVYNSKEPYPMYAIFDDDEEVDVFKDDGTFMRGFLELANS